MKIILFGLTGLMVLMASCSLSNNEEMYDGKLVGVKSIILQGCNMPTLNERFESADCNVIKGGKSLYQRLENFDSLRKLVIVKYLSDSLVSYFEAYSHGRYKITVVNEERVEICTYSFNTNSGLSPNLISTKVISIDDYFLPQIEYNYLCPEESNCNSVIGEFYAITTIKNNSILFEFAITWD